jgi:hypothetical protein
MNTARVTYEPQDEVLFIDTAGLRIDTKGDVDALFNGIVEAWRAQCQSRKVYAVVAYDGFTVNLHINDYYAERMHAAVSIFAKTVIRYGGDSLTRSGARLRGLKLHIPSNLYSSREEALEVVRGLRAGRVSVSG